MKRNYNKKVEINKDYLDFINQEIKELRDRKLGLPSGPLKELKESKMLYEARFSKGISKDGWVHSCSGKAYIIAGDFQEATTKAIDAFMKWKYIDKKDKEGGVLESITLIDNEPVF